MEEEIDLKKYLRPLVRYWYLPIGLAAIAVLAVAVMTMRQPPVYVSRVLVALTDRAEQRASNAQDDSLVALFFTDPTVRRQRLTSLRELVSSPTIARAVLEKVGSQLPGDSRDVTRLLSLVTGNIATSSDLIEITVRHRDRRIATLLADAWGQEYARQVNRTYGDTGMEAYQAIKAQIPGARQRYELAEASWETVLRQDRFTELRRNLAERVAAARSLSHAREAAFPGLVEEIVHLERLLGLATELRRQIEAGGDATSNLAALAWLKVQIYSSGTMRPAGPDLAAHGAGSLDADYPSENAAVTREAPTVGHVEPVVQSGPQQSAALVLQLQLDPGPASADTLANEQLAQDCARMIEILEQRLKSLKESADRMGRALGSATSGQKTAAPSWPALAAMPEKGDPAARALSDRLFDDTLRDLEMQIGDLRVTVAQEENRLRVAQAERDMAWENYAALLRKEAEMVSRLDATVERVRVAAPANTIEEDRGRANKVAAGTVFGLLLGTALAIAIDARRQRTSRKATIES